MSQLEHRYSVVLLHKSLWYGKTALERGIPTFFTSDVEACEYALSKLEESSVVQATITEPNGMSYILK